VAAKRRRLPIGLLGLFVFASAQGICTAALPQQRAFWGIMVGDAGGRGAAVTAIRSDAPAAACLTTGDLLLSINEKKVSSARDFDAVKDSFPLYTPLDLTIGRAGTVRQCQIILEGIASLSVQPVKIDFVIPGVPPPLPPPSVIEALDHVNVLDQVLLDPVGGQIAIIGHYDARFSSGPLPYLDMLKTALRYPKPRLNLTSSIKTEPATMETWKWDGKDVILTHRDMEPERQLLIRAWAAACGLSPEELVTLYNYVNFGPREVKPPRDILAIQGKVLANLGFANAAQAYELVNQFDAAADLKALQLLGPGVEGRMILARSGGEADKGLGRLTAAVYTAIMENIYASAGVANMLREDVAANRITWQEAVKQAQGEMFPVRSKTDNREIVKAALNKLQLTGQGSQVLVKVPLRADVNLAPEDIEPTSQLNRILYEADYSLKSIKAIPHLFWHIPGSMSEQEYEIAKGYYTKLSGARSTDFWLEPRSVAMAVSPDRRVVTFGAAEMSYKSRSYFARQEDATRYGDISGEYDDWCAGVMSRYDDYASVLPALHKVREAAKIIALANWLTSEHVGVDLGRVPQDRWDAPAKVPGFWRASFVYLDETGKGSYALYRSQGAGFSGGVTFKSTGWTAVRTDPAGETGVTQQLALSATLGQKAVQAAQADNLEEARYLAELSAQAMNGSISRAALAKLNIPASSAALPVAAPANVQLQKEMITRTYQQIATAKENKAPRQTTAAVLAQLDRLYDQARSKPLAASEYLIKLQTGQLSVAAAAPVPPVRTSAVTAPAATVCGETSLGAEVLPAERRAYLARKLSEARDRLRHIDEALRKLIAINASQRGEIDKLTAEITEAHEAAVQRASDFVWATLVDLPLAKYADIHEEKLKQLRYEVTAAIGKSTTPLSASGRELLQQEITLKGALAQRYEDGFKSTARLLDLYGGAGYGRDIDKWDRDTQHSDDRKRALEAAKLAGQILLDHPRLKDYLSPKEWFGGNKLWQVVAMGKLAAYGSDFFWDVMNGYLAWAPHVGQLNNDLQGNVQAMENLRQKAAKTAHEIECFEKLLQ
jgi:hypothetical protein